MITYCVGDNAKKREIFIRNGLKRDALCADNDELLAVVEGEKGKFFVQGKIPFGNMRVGEYISYQRSIVQQKRVDESENDKYNRLFKFALRLNKKMRSLDIFKYRYAQILSRYGIGVKRIYLNFDSLLYTRRNKKKMQLLLKKLKKFFAVSVAINDYRFIPQGAKVQNYLPSGDIQSLFLGSFVTQKSKKKCISKEIKMGLKSKIKSVIFFKQNQNG